MSGQTGMDDARLDSVTTRSWYRGRTCAVWIVGSLALACAPAEPSVSPAYTRTDAAPPIVCPSGTKAAGAAPPAGARMWCERDDATQHGPVVEWFAGGQTRLRGEYRDGRKHGTWSSFYDGGKRRTVEHWDAGTPVGTWMTWFADGTHASESLHREGGTIAFRSYRPDGSKQRQGTLVGGREHGRWTEWDPAGVATSSEWKDGVRLGPPVVVKLGIPACDEYLESYSRCIEEKMPEDVRVDMRESLKLSREAWLQVASEPTARANLDAACKVARDAAAQSTASMGCVW